MMERDCTTELAEAVRQAADSGLAVAIRGGGTKDFLGRAGARQALSTAAHRGVVSYAPTELTLTARSGTPLAEIEAVLAEQGQQLPFEPPHFGAGATVGGTVAAGLSGPARPYTGAVRDFVLGTRILNGLGQPMRFGGEVMKNVAGYDVSRLMTGAMGTLGVLLDVSLKVLPRPREHATRVLELPATEAIGQMNHWATQPLPLSATAALDGRVYVRVSGASSGVASACRALGGESMSAADGFWHDLREQRLAFFDDPRPLWRVSVPSTVPPLAVPGDWLLEWGGALRWLRSDVDGGSVRSVAAAAGGSAMLFRGGEHDGDVYHPLAPSVLGLHQRLKHAFDPRGVLNPGRMYPDY
jgi:glycolate oxidase FAD binding subunit